MIENGPPPVTSPGVTAPTSVNARLARARAVAAWLPRSSPLKEQVLAAIGRVEHAAVLIVARWETEYLVARLETLVATAFLLDPEPVEPFATCNWGPQCPGSLGKG